MEPKAKTQKTEEQNEYKPIIPSDLKISPSVLIGIISLSIAFHFIIPLYLIDLSSHFSALSESSIIGNRIIDYLKFHPKSIDFYFSSIALNAFFSFLVYHYMRKNYTPRAAKNIDEKWQAKKMFLQTIITSLVCIYIVWFMPVSNNSGNLYKLGWIVFYPAMPILSSILTTFFAITLLHRIPVTLEKSNA